jgi:hypothetical protein
MTYQVKPKQKNTYPAQLSQFERKRKRDWLKAGLKTQQPIKENQSFKDRDSRKLQMFSGKRGK